MTAPGDLLAKANLELGTHELPPGSNVSYYGQWMGLTPAAWCMEFVSFCWVNVGLPVPGTAQFPDKGWASCGFFLESARAAGWVLASANTAVPGDIVLFAWTPAHITWPDHVGIVEQVYAGGTTFQTIEGNASGPDNVGDEVARHIRPVDSTIAAVIRPPYSGPSILPALGSVPPAAAEPRVLGAPGYPRLSGGVLLQVNSAHHDLVAIYQTRMSQRGWKIGIDGVFGPQTDSITRQFQSEKHLSLDGVVGPETWNGAFTLPVTP